MDINVSGFHLLEHHRLVGSAGKVVSLAARTWVRRQIFGKPVQLMTAAASWKYSDGWSTPDPLWIDEDGPMTTVMMNIF